MGIEPGAMNAILGIALEGKTECSDCNFDLLPLVEVQQRATTMHVLASMEYWYLSRPVVCALTLRRGGLIKGRAKLSSSFTN